MKLKAVALLLVICLTGQASAQIVVVARPGDALVFGGLRYGYPRGFLIGSTTYVSQVTFYPPPVILLPQGPLISVKRLPVLGPGYSQDTRGVDLDLVPTKKGSPLTEDTGTDPAKPLPGVEVSKSRPSVRPADARVDPPIKLPPPLPPAVPAPPLPKPQGSLADPLKESAKLMEFGLAAFQAGEFGLAAQRFRQAAAVAPQQPRPVFLLAQAQVAVGDYRAAVAAIQSGIKLDKLWPRTQIHPRLELYKGRDAEYSEHAHRLADSLAAYPNNPLLMFLTAHQMWFDGRAHEAVAMFQRARPLVDDPSFIDAFLAVNL